MNKTILVDLPSDQQIELTVKPSAVNAPGNGYSGPGTVVWNEVVDGDIPAYTLGGAVRDVGPPLTLTFSQSRKDDHDAAVAALNIPKVVKMWAMKEAVDLKEILDTDNISNLNALITAAINSESDAVMKLKLKSRWVREGKMTFSRYEPDGVTENEFVIWAKANVTGMTNTVVDELFTMAFMIQNGEEVDPTTWTYP